MCPFHIFQCQRKPLLYPNFRNIHEDAICLRQNRKLKPLVIALGLYIWEYHQIYNISHTLAGNKISDHSDVVGA